MTDPGTYDLYASRPSNEVAGQTETVLICSGNVKIQLGSVSVNAFNIGGN